MTRIYPRVIILDKKLKTPGAAKRLLDELSVHLAHIRELPSKRNVSEFLQYYQDEFGLVLDVTTKSLQEDLQLLQSASARRDSYVPASKA
jgi:hypothetical protein